MRKALSICLVFASLFLLSTAWAQGDDQFQVPADKNTYIVTYNLRGLECVQDIGTPTQCAVANQSADEGGYPWTKVKCRGSDASISTFAWSLDLNQPMDIYEAPPSLTTSAKTSAVNVRLGRVCMRSGK
jgi:hypothetical protein